MHAIHETPAVGDRLNLNVSLMNAFTVFSLPRAKLSHQSSLSLLLHVTVSITLFRTKTVLVNPIVIP